MAKQTIWLIIANVAPIVGAVLVYLGLHNGIDAPTAIGVALFALGMLVTPTLRMFSPAQPKQDDPAEDSPKGV
jgi:ACR3 family arsenite efflux pump ArsB